jgi:hypothetical protein
LLYGCSLLFLFEILKGQSPVSGAVSGKR